MNGSRAYDWDEPSAPQSYDCGICLRTFIQPAGYPSRRACHDCEANLKFLARVFRRSEPKPLSQRIGEWIIRFLYGSSLDGV